MTKYESFNRRRASKPRAVNPHPIWNGIGCLMLIIVPVIAFGLAVITLDAAVEKEWPLPAQFLGYIRLPRFLYSSQVLVPVLDAITGIEYLYGYLAFTLFYTIIFGGIMSFVYAL